MLQLLLQSQSGCHRAYTRKQSVLSVKVVLTLLFPRMDVALPMFLATYPLPPTVMGAVSDDDKMKSRFVVEKFTAPEVPHPLLEVGSNGLVFAPSLLLSGSLHTQVTPAGGSSQSASLALPAPQAGEASRSDARINFRISTPMAVRFLCNT